jgi:hypothetical protein
MNMDLVSMIVYALVSGIVQGVQSATSTLVIESYQVLRDRIVSTYDDIDLGGLEQDPTSEERQAEVAAKLRRAQADKDGEIVRLAQDLLHMAEYGSTTTRVNDTLERTARGAATEAVNQVVENHIRAILQIRSSYPVNDRDLFSGNVMRIEGIPDALRQQVADLHGRIRRIIDAVAARIEERNYASAEQAIAAMQLAYLDQQRAKALIDADKQVHISFQTLRTAVQLFAQLNETIIDKIERREASDLTETNLLLGNAILVYELTDYAISFLEDFSVRGIAEINTLHTDAKKKLAELRVQQSELRRKTQADGIDAMVTEQIAADIETREKSINLLEAEWQQYVSSIISSTEEVKEVRSKIPTLEVIRENAKIQIGVIGAVGMLRILRQNVGAMETTILTLEKMKLVSLSPNRVRRLLGIS